MPTPRDSASDQRNAEIAVLAALGDALESGQARAGKSRAWRFLRGVSVHLGNDVVQPSLAAWPADGFAQPKGDQPVTAVPIWVCELVSAASARAVRVAKQTLYIRERVEFVWILDLELRTLETLRWIDGRLTELEAYGDEDRVRAVPFEDFELDLGALWAKLEKVV